ncbi:MAG: hypothetical protein QOJ70_391 [Acidobacteriota bacterium]|jgi:hypothetical protein|nr:hypothetical protein [Acidobacteriota bacterium]
MGGLKCHACRRFVLRRVHVFLLILAGVVALVGLLELLERLTPTSIKSF